MAQITWVPHDFCLDPRVLTDLGSELHFRIRLVQPAIKVRSQKQWALLLLGESLPPLTHLLLYSNVYLPLGQFINRLREKMRM